MAKELYKDLVIDEEYRLVPFGTGHWSIGAPELGEWEMSFRNEFYNILFVLPVAEIVADKTLPPTDKGFANPIKAEVCILKEKEYEKFLRQEEVPSGPFRGFVKAFTVPIDDGKDELAMIQGDDRRILWALAGRIPVECYPAAMTLIQCDRMIREWFPGWCLIKNEPELVKPDRSMFPFLAKEGNP